LVNKLKDFVHWLNTKKTQCHKTKHFLNTPFASPITSTRLIIFLIVTVFFSLALEMMPVLDEFGKMLRFDSNWEFCTLFIGNFFIHGDKKYA
jgi:hypothetical protein